MSSDALREMYLLFYILVNVFSMDFEVRLRFNASRLIPATLLMTVFPFF